MRAYKEIAVAAALWCECTSVIKKYFRGIAIGKGVCFMEEIFFI